MKKLILIGVAGLLLIGMVFSQVLTVKTLEARYNNETGILTVAFDLNDLHPQCLNEQTKKGYFIDRPDDIADMIWVLDDFEKYCINGDRLPKPKTVTTTTTTTTTEYIVRVIE